MPQAPDTFEQRASPVLSAIRCRMDDEGLTVGSTSVAWADISGFGVAVQDGAVGVGGVRVRKMGTTTRNYLLFAYVDRASSKAKELVVPLGGEDDPMVGAVRRRIPDKWRGTDFYLRLRATLGFSNKGIKWIIAACIVLALVITAVVVVVAVSRHDPSSRPTPTRSGPRSR